MARALIGLLLLATACSPVAREPETKPFIDMRFRRGVPFEVENRSDQERRLLRESGDPEKARIADLVVEVNTQMNEFSQRVPDTRLEQISIYQEEREYVNFIYDTYGKKTARRVFRKRFEAMSPAQQHEYIARRLVLPLQFWTRTDFDLILGIKMTERTAQAMLFVSKQPVRVQLAREEGKELGPLYDDLDAFVRKEARQNKQFARIVKLMNCWGCALRRVGYTGEYDKIGPILFAPPSLMDNINGFGPRAYWKETIELANFIRKKVDELYGPNPFIDLTSGSDSEVEGWYREARDIVLKRVNKLRERNREFNEEWEELQEVVGEPLIEWLIPNVYFGPLGGG